MKKIIIFIFALSLNNYIVAQAINGKVLLGNSDTPISEALVKVIKDGKVKTTVKTNFNGEFKVKASKGGNLNIEISKESYQTIKTTISEENFIVRLEAKSGIPNFDEIKEGSVRKIPNPEITESIGNLSNLPEGTKIIEIIPLEVKEVQKSGFNVQPTSNKGVSSVDVQALKESFNKQNIDTFAFSTIEKFPSSYLAEGNVYFGEGKALLTWAVQTHLQQLAKSITGKKSIVKITAYADANQETKVGNYIAKLRAEEVVKILFENGVDFSQLEILVTGNKVLQNNCYENKSCSEFEHQQNRRVEIEIIKP